jgi:heme-degrading monooxygenase HmoA
MPVVFVALSRFAVAEKMVEQVCAAFRDRPHEVDDVPGFLRMEVCCPGRADKFWLATLDR